MRKHFGKNTSLVIIGSLFLALPVCAANEEQPAKSREDPSGQIMPDAVSQLFQWPAPQVIEAKSVTTESPEVAFPKKQCAEWVHKVIDPAWLPEKTPEPFLLRDEIDGCDVVRHVWSKQGHRIEVAQTASLFVMKLTPEDERSLGKDNQEKLNAAKELCLQVFAKQARRWAGQGTTIAVSNLAQKIASYSFREDTAPSAQTNSAILFGRPRTLNEEHTTAVQERLRVESATMAPNSSWDMTADAWRYWFRRIYWWNDGKSLRVFLPKVEGVDARADAGIGLPDYGGSIDKNWFRLPKDRSGRTLPQK
jgi:hypothetical protein